MEKKFALPRFKIGIRMVRNLLLLLLVLILLVPFLSPVLAQVEVPPIYLPLVTRQFTSTSIFGFHMDTITDEGLNQLSTTKSKWTRRDFIWEVVEPTEGLRSWSNRISQDQELINAANRNVNVIMILGGTPAWARVNSDCPGRVRPDKFAALGNFVYDMVQRYKSPPFNIKYWELWNEPDTIKVLGCWGIPGDTYYGGDEYSEMLKVVYPRIKQADPDAQVLVGGLLLDCDPRNPPIVNGASKDCSPSRFIEGILVNQGGAYFDGISFHGYDFFENSSRVGYYSNANWNSYSSGNGPVSLVKAHYLQDLLNQYQVPSKTLVQTENAVFCDTDNCKAGADSNYEITKSIYIVQSNVQAIVEGWKANIWWAYYCSRGSGLFLPNGQATRSYYTYKFTANELGTAISGRRLDIGVGVMAYEIKRENDVVWVLWSSDGMPHTISLPIMPQSVYHISADNGSGVSVPVSQSFTIDSLPWFIEVRP